MQNHERKSLPLFDEFAELARERDEISLLAGIPAAILILGPPGSGKGTQAGMLSERLSLPHVSTGDMLRDRILVGDDLGRRIAERIDVGQFVPDEWINQLLDERLAHADCRRGIILDGYPRTLPQAERLTGRLDEMGFLSIAARLLAGEEMLTARFAGRRQCPICSALFHLEYQPSLAGVGCDRPGCNGLLQVRADDSPEFIVRRLADFERLTEPVITVLEASATTIVEVDAGLGMPEEIHDRLLSHVLRAMRESAPRATTRKAATPLAESIDG